MPILLILLTAGVLFVGVGIYMVFTGRSNAVKNRLEGYVTPTSLTAKPSSSSGKAFGSIRQLYNSFAGAIYSESTFRKLASANWPLSVAEFVLIKVVLVIGLFAISFWIFNQLILGIVLALFANFILEFFLSRAIAKRKDKFRDQLVDVLIMLSSSIRAGFSLPQAIDVVATEMAPPASDEFRRVKREVEIGISLSQALLNLANRMEDDDLSLVVTAININIRAGGSLSRVLDHIVETCRDRIRLLFETRALTSYARYTGNLLSFLPIIVVVIIRLVSPLYFNPVLSASPLIIMPPVIAILLGNLWLGRIARTRV